MAEFQKFVVLGAVAMINCSLNFSYYIGNLSTYIFSLHYLYGQNESFDIDVNWFLPAYMITRFFGTFLADFATKLIGLRLTVACGMALSISSVFLTYFTVLHSVWASTLTLAFVGGFGNSILFMCNMMYVALWFDQSVGLASALPCSAGAVGGIVMNQIITGYINPRNRSPDSLTRSGDVLFFSQQEIIDRVPMVFVVMGAVVAGLQLLGFCFLKNPYKNRVPLCEEETGLLDGTKLVDEDLRCPFKYQEGLGVLRSEESDFGNKQENRMSFCGNSSESPEGKERSLLMQTVEDENNDVADLEYVTFSLEEEMSKTPLQVLKSPTFYYLQCAVIAQALGLLIVVNYYKFFGQLWIYDDEFLAFIGSCSSFFIIPSLLLCGAIFDKFGVKKVFIGHLATSVVFLNFWYFTAMLNRWLYLVWVVTLYCAFMNLYLCMTLATLKLFGKRHYAANFGLVQGMSLIPYFLGPPLATYALSAVGWFWMFFITGAVTFVLMIPVLVKISS